MKKAITYYYSFAGYSGIKFHDTGKQAVETILKDQKVVFSRPIIKKDNMKLTHKNQVTIGFPFRQLVARFLDDEELGVIKNVGLENIWFNHEEGKVVSNPNI